MKHRNKNKKVVLTGWEYPCELKSAVKGWLLTKQDIRDWYVDSCGHKPQQFRVIIERIGNEQKRIKKLS